MSNDVTTEQGFRRMIDHMIEQANEELALFQKRFAQNPAYTFEWSLEAFQAAANLDVATRAKAYLDAGRTRDEVQKEMVESARYMVRLEGSTSPTSNLLQQAKAIATLKLAGIKA